MNANFNSAENGATPESAYGVLTEPGTLTLHRRLPGPVERVWAYLTESDLRRQWLAAGELGTQVGAPIEFVWRNDELNSPPGRRPVGFPEEQRMKGQIAEFSPFRKLTIAWDGFGEVSYELERKSDDVLLTMVQRGLPGREVILMFASGSHMHLDILDARLTGKEPPQFWDGWSRQRAEYERRMPA